MSQDKSKSSTGPKKKGGLGVFEVFLVGVLGIAGYLAFSGMTDNQTPTMVVMDRSEIVDARMKKGDTPVEALVYLKTLIKMYKHNGIMVLDKKQMISYPDELNIKQIDKETLYQIAKENNMAVTTADYEDAKKSIESQRQEILNQIYKQPR